MREAILTLLGLGSYLAAGVLAIFGYLTNRPDSSIRFMLRVWVWITIALGVEFIDWAVRRDWSWWHYLYIVGVAWLVIGGVQRNWRKAEACRKFERAAANYRPNWTIR